MRLTNAQRRNNRIDKEAAIEAIEETQLGGTAMDDDIHAILMKLTAADIFTLSKLIAMARRLEREKSE
jgi:hypothetical protein